MIVDAVFSTHEFRTRAINIAQACCVPIEAWWIDTPSDECLRRNAQREPDRRIAVMTLRQFHQNLLNEPPDVTDVFVAVRRT